MITEQGRTLQSRIQEIIRFEGDIILRLCGEDFPFHNQAVLHTAKRDISNSIYRASGEAHKKDLDIGQLVRIDTLVIRDHAERKWEFIKELALIQEDEPT